MAVKITPDDPGFRTEITTCASKIDNHKTVLDVTPAEVDSLKADAAATDYIMGINDAVQTFAHSCTSFKHNLRHGGADTLGAIPVLPVFGQAPVMPDQNIEKRFRSLIQRIVKHPKYTSAIGQDLGIEGPVVPFIPEDGKPAFYVSFSSGGHPDLHWKKGQYQGVEIWKDSGAGFLKLERDMHPDFIDKTALPAIGLSAVWKYKMIYLINDEQVGSWSDVVSVTVHGEV